MAVASSSPGMADCLDVLDTQIMTSLVAGLPVGTQSVSTYYCLLSGLGSHFNECLTSSGVWVASRHKYHWPLL